MLGMSAAAADAGVGPSFRADLFGDGPEVKGPAIEGPTGMEAAEQIGEPAQEGFASVGEEDHTAGIGAAEILLIEERERGEEIASTGEAGSGGGFDACDQGGGGGEGIDVSAAAGEPAVDAIGKSARVGDGDEEEARGAKGAGDFGEDGVEFGEVFERVVRDDGVEGVISEGEMGGIGADIGRAFEIEADGEAVERPREAARWLPRSRIRAPGESCRRISSTGASVPWRAGRLHRRGRDSGAGCR